MHSVYLLGWMKIKRLLCVVGICSLHFFTSIWFTTLSEEQKRCFFLWAKSSNAAISTPPNETIKNIGHRLLFTSVKIKEAKKSTMHAYQIRMEFIAWAWLLNILLDGTIYVVSIFFRLILQIQCNAIEWNLVHWNCAGILCFSF